MSAINLPLSGGCRCGQVRFRVTAKPLLTMACHCKGCQRMTASAYSLSAAIPADGFDLLQGGPVVGGLRNPHQRHYHCPHCMSWVFSKSTGLEFMVNVRATMFDDTSWFAPLVDIYTSEKLPWVSTGAPHGYPHYPGVDVFQELMAEYAKTV
jgi:hypothetical protein